ncbi:MAG: hypothetical protein RL112_811 [Planctomycetota bacterium]
MVEQPGAGRPAAEEAAWLARAAAVQGDDGLRRACLERAAALDPEWVFPQRELDTLEVEALRGPAAWARRQRAAEEAETATRLYLLGRLEGDDGAARFQRAVALDARHAWSWHALGVVAARQGRAAQALEHARAAARHAQGELEEVEFARVLAARLAAADARDEARQVLSAARARCARASARAALDLQLAELGLEPGVVDDEAIDLGLELVARGGIESDELERLCLLLSLACQTSDLGALFDRALLDGARQARGASLAVLERHLAWRADAAGDARAALRRLEAAQLLDGEEASGPRLRLLRLRDGRLVEAFERRAEEFEGLVAVEARLRELVEPARRAEELGDAPSLVALLEACEARGLHEECAVLARRLGALDARAGAEWERRAAAGRAALAALRRLAARIDRRAEGAPRDLDALLSGMAACAAPTLGRPADEVAAAWRADERESHLGIAEMVEPLPDGRARSLARDLRALGRFVLCWDHAGSAGPDLVVLPLILESPLRGEHLGVHYEGTVSLCEEADIGPRAARQGSAIAGAALHKGYWLDLDAVRPSAALWRRQAEQWNDPRAVRALLAQELPRTSDPARLVPTHGEGRRLVLAALLERGGGERVDAPGLADVASLAMLHEEGHLVDRALHLPVWRNLPGVARLLVDGGFGARGVQEELELRAELVGWCKSPDPRLAIGKALSDAEAGDARTPHAAAYRRLLQEFLRLVHERAADLPGLDPLAPLCMQLSRLPAATLRELAFELSRRRHLGLPPSAPSGGAVKQT